MIAVAEHSTAAVLPFAGRYRDGEAARDLALGYLRYASACWRGEAVAAAFAARLDGFWRRDMPPGPAAPPDAVSPHGGSGRGIHWYETGGEVLGYVPGARGGYDVPVSAVRRLLECVPAAPCAIQPAPLADMMERRALAIV